MGGEKSGAVPWVLGCQSGNSCGGVVCDVTKPDKQAGGIVRLTDDLEFRKKLSAGGVRCVREMFERVVDAYEVELGSVVQIDKKLSLKLSRVSFLCAMLVVAIHCSYRIDSFDELPRVFAWFQAVVNYGVTRIAVPLFFVIFGFLFFRDFDQSVKWWLRKLRKRTTSTVSSLKVRI